MSAPGLFVTGHMRSGTSMTAGLFAHHGVFFGKTGGTDSHNRKGAYENLWLKRNLRGNREPPNWPDSWWDRLRAEGWDGETPWGVKVVAVHWQEIQQLEPDVVVLCYRPKEAILDSCEAFGGGKRWGRAVRDPVIDDHWAIMDAIQADYPGLVVPVWTPDLIDGDASALFPVFDALGVEFDQEAMDRWVDPALWHHHA